MKTTTHYDLFTLEEENRDVDLSDKETKNLAESMVEYGWLEAFPLMAQKQGRRLVVKDGQHRLALSREFGIPVKYVVIEGDLPDVARLQMTAKKWKTKDYAARYAKAGNDHYIELLEFFDRYGIPLTMSAAILANTTTFANVSDRFYDGRYQIRSRRIANDLADCWRELVNASKVFSKVQAIKALWACFHVDYFDQKRLISGANRHGKAIKNMADLEGFLEMFEEIYNFGRKDRAPLKFDAVEAMKARKPVGFRSQ